MLVVGQEQADHLLSELGDADVRSKSLAGDCFLSFRFYKCPAPSQ